VSSRISEPIEMDLQYSHGNHHWLAALGTLRLLQHISRVLQRRLEEEQKNNTGRVDRKLRRRTQEKKLAQGLRE